MTLCLATTSVPGDLFGKLEEIAAAGFTGVELYEPDLTVSSKSPKEIGDFANSLGLRIEVLQPFHDFEGLEGADRTKAFDRLGRKLELMHDLRAKTLMVGTTGHVDASGAFEQIVDDFSSLAEQVRADGLRSAVIARPWARHITTTAAALKVVEAVDDPALGLVLNSYFSLADGALPAELRDVPGDRIFHVQLSDAPAVNSDIARLKRHFGLLPGQGALNLAGFVRVIARSGYNGPWSLARVSESANSSNENLARDGFRALVSLLDEVAQTEPALATPMPDLPPRVYTKGFEFIEFAATTEGYEVLTDMLTSLRFRKERQHVSKSVELWRQGAINIVVNSDKDGFAAAASKDHGTTVCDMGLRVSDADQTVKRATALGAPEFSQPVGAGELDIPAIKGVGASVVHFIDERSDLHRVWDIEFEPVPKATALQPAGLRRVDHVAQTMRYEDMQSWLTYYTSTFEMEKAALVDVVDPSGLVLSQALSSPEGEVRLNLNGAGEKRTFAGAFLADQFGAGVQHIAFLSDDIIETSEHLEASGFSRLEMPHNYYEDLSVSFGLDDALVEKLQSANILYDRDEKSEYFQIYSTPILNGFFFEIVERRSGYDGYGARNAPIRLAAQNRFQAKG